jgi:hypothetical protein
MALVISISTPPFRRLSPRFCRYSDYPATVPLGHFPTSDSGVGAFQLAGPPEPQEPLASIGFVEVYWADVPRKLQSEGYVIEEAKAWARTVVDRFRARYQTTAQNLDGKTPSQAAACLHLGGGDYQAGANAIEQMIDTFRVLDNLLFIAGKAGIVKFDLAELLTTYLGDVQIVAEFQQHRRRILEKFREVMNRIKLESDPEIYIIAHSEGTVIALMGLLEAMCHPAKQPLEYRKGDWRPILKPDPTRPTCRNGSATSRLHDYRFAIDKHLVLWPEIWDPVQTPHPQLPARAEGKKIEWRNYYDFGDPVGFRLDTAAEWLKKHGWHKVFSFDPEKHDYGFGRYLLPGAAHNDYWRDEGVFGHFIKDVILREQSDPPAVPPDNRPLRRIGSNVIPYLLILGVLYLGSYLAYKGLHAYAGATAAEQEQLVRNVSGITALLAGMIALARIPRLTRSPRGSPARSQCLPLAPRSSPVESRARSLGGCHYEPPTRVALFAKPWARARFRRTDSSASVRSSQSPGLRSSRVLPHGALGAIGGTVTAAHLPLCAILRWGATAGPAGRCVSPPDHSCTRPHRLKHRRQSAVAALSGRRSLRLLWWLAILLFDLVFAWHRYIRNSVAHDYLYALRKGRKQRESNPDKVAELSTQTAAG